MDLLLSHVGGLVGLAQQAIDDDLAAVGEIGHMIGRVLDELFCLRASLVREVFGLVRQILGLAGQVGGKLAHLIDLLLSTIAALLALLLRRLVLLLGGAVQHLTGAGGGVQRGGRGLEKLLGRIVGVDVVDLVEVGALGVLLRVHSCSSTCAVGVVVVDVAASGVSGYVARPFCSTKLL